MNQDSLDEHDFGHRESLSSAPARPDVGAARRLVVKLGTRVLIDDATGDLAADRLASIVAALAAAYRAGREVLVVSSGAVFLGRRLLGLDSSPDADTKRACAALGQARLMALWGELLGRQKILAAQVLLTEEDFDHRRRYLDLRSTIETLLRRGVLPIFNENDAVPHGAQPGQRSVFGDNDRLAALLAVECHADLLVLLTDVDGVYESDPRRDPEARLLSQVDDAKALLPTLQTAAAGSVGRGGMASKVEAARIAARGGCTALIAPGRRPELLPGLLAGEAVGTYFPPQTKLPAQRGWIAFAAAARGTLHLDAGAVAALRAGRSLLAVGVAQIDGEFRPGEVVELRGPKGELIGRGRMTYDSTTARRWCAGEKPPGEPNCLLRRTFVVLEDGP